MEKTSYYIFNWVNQSLKQNKLKCQFRHNVNDIIKLLAREYKSIAHFILSIIENMNNSSEAINDLEGQKWES